MWTDLQQHHHHKNKGFASGGAGSHAHANRGLVHWPTVVASLYLRREGRLPVPGMRTRVHFTPNVQTPCLWLGRKWEGFSFPLFHCTCNNTLGPRPHSGAIYTAFCAFLVLDSVQLAYEDRAIRFFIIKAGIAQVGERHRSTFTAICFSIFQFCYLEMQNVFCC